jgi:putative transposase
VARRNQRQTDCRLQHITTRGNNRRMIFDDADDRERFYTLLGTAIAEHEVECHQDVLMGNHVHLLLEGPMPAISEAMWYVSQRYALAYNVRRGRTNHLLGQRFHSSDVLDEAAARAVCIYLAMNPVRAGLCRHPAEWEYGSFRGSTGWCRPRPHLTPGFTHALYENRRTTFADAVEAAVVLNNGGRPRLADILPDADRLTILHVRQACDVFGYTATDIEEYYERSARTLRRWCVT